MLCIASAASAQDDITTSFGTFVGEQLRSDLVTAISGTDWPEDMPPPSESVKREAFYSRGSTIACTNSAAALVNSELLRQDVSSDPQQGLRYYAALRRYVEDCLRPLGTVSNPYGGYAKAFPDETDFLGTVAYSTLPSLIERSILYVPEGFGQRCSASLVWIQNGQSPPSLFLVTAAHCVAREISSDTGIVNASLFKTLVFDDLQGTRRVISTNGGEAEYLLLGSDIAAIDLGGDFDPSAVGFPTANDGLAPWDHFYVIGQNPYLHSFEVRRYNRNPAGVDVPNGHATAISMEFGCRAFGYTLGVVLHNCQTTRGTSGAGVFSIEHGKLVFHGVHSGNSRAFEIDQGADPAIREMITSANAKNYLTLLRP